MLSPDLSHIFARGSDERQNQNLVSWFLRTLMQLIGVGAAWFAGADVWATINIFIAGMMALIICIFVLFYKQSYRKPSIFDYICGCCALLALGFWLGAQDPIKALRLSIIADCIASIPTIIKTWKYPHTETGLIYIVSILGILLAIPSIPKRNIANTGFQIYLISLNIIILLCIYRKYRIISASKNYFFK